MNMGEIRDTPSLMCELAMTVSGSALSFLHRSDGIGQDVAPRETKKERNDPQGQEAGRRWPSS